MAATCCWCQTALVSRLLHGVSVWICPQPACAARQSRYAVLVATPGRSTPRLVHLPLPKQVQLEECPAKYILFGGAAGVSKSTGARWRLYRRCLTIPGFEALLLRRTFPELEKTHLRRMETDQYLIGATFEKSNKLMRFPNGSLLECGHMEDADAVQKYLSTEYDEIVPDEGSTFAPEALFELSTRARTSKPAVLAAGGAKFVVVSNPGGPAASLLLDFFIDHQPDFDTYPALRQHYRPEEWVYLAGTLDDNPYLDPEYERQLALLPTWRYQQLRYGDWRVFTGQFFSSWSDRHHVADLGPIGDGVLRFCSHDWGYNQAGCNLWWSVLGDGRLYVQRDYKFQQQDLEAVVTRLKQIDGELGWTRPAYTAASPDIFWTVSSVTQRTRAHGEMIAETFQRLGRPMQAADTERVNGWMRLQMLLRAAPDGKPWLIVHPDCRYLMRSLAAATSDKHNPDDVGFADDHALDACRYGAMSRPHPLAARVAHAADPMSLKTLFAEKPGRRPLKRRVA